MKKRIALFTLVICTLFTVLPSTSLEILAEAEIIYGDANEDGIIDLKDILQLEKYLTDEKTKINMINADVNVDGIIDVKDINLIREFLVGNIASLVPELCTLSFETTGGGDFADISVGKGYFYQKDLPRPSKEGLIFIGWVKPDGSTFYQQDPVTENLLLVAAYKEVESKEVLNITSFSLTNQSPDVEFRILGGTSSADIDKNITLMPKDGSDPVAIDIREDGNGVFIVSAKEGFMEAASYELTLNDKLTFEGEDEKMRTVNFIINKIQIDNLYYNDDLIFLEDTDQINYEVDGKTQEMLELGLFSNDGPKDISGKFILTESSLEVGNYLCIYENVDPRDRDYTQNDYEKDRVAYIKITAVDGNSIDFKNLDEKDTQNILRIPDSVPYKVDELPQNNEGIVDKNNYDASARITLGFETPPEFREGDMLIFYAEDFEIVTKDTQVRYGRVLNTEGTDVHYKIISKDDVDSYMGMFVSKEVEGDEIAEKMPPEFLDDVEKQALNSGFVDGAVEQMLQSALQTDSLKKQLKENGITKDEMNSLVNSPSNTTTKTTNKNRVKLTKETVKVKASLITGEKTQFDKGIGIDLNVHVVLSIDKKISDTEVNSLKIDLTASFKQEVAVNININVEDKWTWYVFVPVLDELSCYTNVDIKSYTNVSVGARLYTIPKELQSDWENVASKINDPNVQSALIEINKLGVLVKKNKDNIEKVQEYLGKIDEYRKKLPELLIGGNPVSFEEMENEFSMTDVGSELQEVLEASNADESKVGIDNLVDKYSNMLNQESEWIQLLNKVLYEQEFHINIVAVKIEVSFNIKANLNISLGADIEYQTGKRYNFWVHVFERNAGSSEMDLLDEKFGFQFYVMGALGLKMGVKAEISVGIISTKIASIGANVEFGPYLKIYGYFFYTYTKLRPANTQQWETNEEMMGALYLDFGLYLEVKFKAQAFDGTFQYEPTLYDSEYPLLTIGVDKNVYGFANEPGKDAVFRVVDNDGDVSNGIHSILPSSYLQMKTLHLVTGDKTLDVHKPSKFHYELSNHNFVIDANGLITVTPPEGVRHMTSDLIITWVSDKMAFSKYDMSIKVPLVWTNMSDLELNEEFTVSVEVGNSSDGYSAIWSNNYTRKDVFDLPTQEEILKLIKYDSYNADDINLKYSTKGDYVEKETKGLSVTNNKIFYYDIAPRKYELEVNEIQKDDGTTENQTITTIFGEKFRLPDYKKTGTNDTMSNNYTSFLNLTNMANENVVFDINTIADMLFYETYGFKADTKANYMDNTLHATFNFKGVEMDSITLPFKKGTMPEVERIKGALDEKFDYNSMINEITPIVGEVFHSITYEVHVQLKEAGDQYTIKFDTNGGSVIGDQSYFENSSILKPSTPKKKGYEFSGWYEDKNLTVPFQFEGAKMQKGGMIIFSKWDAKISKVLLKAGKQEKGGEVAYGNSYGDFILEKPDNRQNEKFVGWYTTESTGGERITPETIFKETTDTILYARWEPKLTLDLKNDLVIEEGQKHVYDKKQKPIIFNLKEPHNGKTTLTPLYRLSGISNNFTSDAPENAGKYDVKFTHLGDENYLQADELLVSEVHIIDKAVPVLKGGGTHSIGSQVRISKPQSDSDGSLSYHLEGSGIAASNKSDDGLFVSVEQGWYNSTVRYTEGANYEAIESKKFRFEVKGPTKGSYTANIVIKTGDKLLAGTDGRVEAGIANAKDVYFSDPMYMAFWEPMKELNNNGKKDFERNNLETYFIANEMEPWTIKRARITKNGTDNWYLDWFKINVKRNNQSFDGGVVGVRNTDFLSGAWESDFNGMKGLMPYRKITNVDDFYSGGEESIDLNAEQKENYKYSYSGRIADQYYPEGYNALERAIPPQFSVTSGNPKYDNFINYTGVASFEIDTVGLAEHIKKNGGKNFTFKVSLKIVDHYFTTDGSFFEKDIVVKVPGTTRSSTENSEIPFSLNILETVDLRRANLSKDSPIILSADTMVSNSGNFIEVPVQVEGSKNIWGIHGHVNYDKNILELKGYETKECFKPTEFTTSDDLDTGRFNFLATRNSLKDSVANGCLMILTFKIKEDAVDQATALELNITQSINVDSDEITSKNSSGSVIVDNIPPAITGIEDGGVYHESQKVTVYDENLSKVSVNGKEVSLTNGEFTLTPEEGVQIVEAIDLADQRTIVAATVNTDKGNPGEETGDPNKEGQTDDPNHIKQSEKDKPNVKTGDAVDINLLLVIATVSFVVILLLRKRKREDN